ncbi:MAG: hypothetical protein COA96_16905 [SAR86 cluster bacterium]|uniref:Uncharacterized protein n=1 Tax=SAR86 cluster bacterium TaxID=2030880 RepID=A0A2A5AHQ4_9GAMM|nr:MAG: hypothetical protein COA96_16905 [SAR86 cluster bacterium]
MTLERYPLGKHRFVEAHKNESGVAVPMRWCSSSRRWSCSTKKYTITIDERDGVIGGSGTAEEIFREAIRAIENEEDEN